MSWLNALNATLVAKLAPLFCTQAMHWIALLCLCSVYLQGGLTKALDLIPPEAASPLAVAVMAMEIGASVLVLSDFLRCARSLMLGVLTSCAMFVANRFWDASVPKQYTTENSFFERFGLVGGFILVAWYDLQG